MCAAREGRGVHYSSSVSGKVCTQPRGALLKLGLLESSCRVFKVSIAVSISKPDDGNGSLMSGPPNGVGVLQQKGGAFGVCLGCWLGQVQWQAPYARSSFLQKSGKTQGVPSCI